MIKRNDIETYTLWIEEARYEIRRKGDEQMRGRNCGAKCKKSKFCPECGARLAEDGFETSVEGNMNKEGEQNPENKKPIYTRWWFWLIVALFGIMVYSFMSKSDSNDAGVADVKEKENVVKDVAVKKIVDY